MHRDESPEFAVHRVEPRRRSTAVKQRPQVPDSRKPASGTPASERPGAACDPSLWDADIDGPHAPNLVIRGRGSVEEPDDPASFSTSVDPAKPLHLVILEDFRRIADALIQSLHAFRKAMRPRGPRPPMPA